MIITRTPFRITLGGGGTDLPSYYQAHGGFLLTSAIDKYMYVAINTPFIDRLLRVKYSKSEVVENVDQLQHELAREALKHFGIRDTLEIISFADISAGTGMGSSSCYLVGLLNALQSYLRKKADSRELAEVACRIEIDILGKPVGKQDAYIASYGGFLKMEIAKDGTVKATPADISMATVRNLERNLLLYYSGVQRNSADVLIDQNQAIQNPKHAGHAQVQKSMQRISALGQETLQCLEAGNIRRFGEIMHEHWMEKKQLSSKISNPRIDEIYDEARRCGAVGGKIVGAGGGGFLLLYAEEKHTELDALMEQANMRRLEFRFDFEGSKSLLNLADSRNEYQKNREPHE